MRCAFSLRRMPYLSESVRFIQLSQDDEAGDEANYFMRNEFNLSRHQ
jgi:hypothetical protein